MWDYAQLLIAGHFSFENHPPWLGEEETLEIGTAILPSENNSIFQMRVVPP